MAEMRSNMATAVAKLDTAIEMHQMHLDDPDTATPESQREMMTLMTDARSALGAMGMDDQIRGAARGRGTGRSM